jgi:hypothetical protein
LLLVYGDDGDDVPYTAREIRNNHQDKLFSFWDNGRKHGHHRHQCHQHRCGRSEQAVLTEVLTNRELQEQLQQAAHPAPLPKETHRIQSKANRLWQVTTEGATNGPEGEFCP